MIIAMTDMDEMPQMCMNCRKLGPINAAGQHYCTETAHVLDSVYSKPGDCPLREVEHHCKCERRRHD